MVDQFQHIKAVGFDLDGTLYKITPEIDDRIQTKVAEKILEKKPELETLENARKFHAEKFQEFESASRTLAAAGYPIREAGLIMKGILEESDITDLIPEDPKLTEILKKIDAKYFTYLVTTSPKTIGLKKLKKIGLSEDLFNWTAFGDAPWFAHQPKTVAFEHVIEESGIPRKEHVYIGDRPKADIFFPKALGMLAIAVHGEVPEADLSIHEIHEIENILL